MTLIRYAHGTLTVLFPRWEAAMTGCGSFSAHADQILSVELLDGWTSEVLGYRSGLVISGYRKLGVFTHPAGTRRLVSMKRGLPLLRVRLRRSEQTRGFDELLLSTPAAADILASIGTQGRDA
jgi:hypothetical protein